jgi:hypothetical protein
VIVVEGTQAFEFFAGRAQGDVSSNDVDDVVGLFDPLAQGIVRQRTPIGRRASFRKRPRPFPVSNASVPSSLKLRWRFTEKASLMT